MTHLSVLHPRWTVVGAFLLHIAIVTNPNQRARRTTYERLALQAKGFLQCWLEAEKEAAWHKKRTQLSHFFE
jgi:hypothetical protein